MRRILNLFLSLCFLATAGYSQTVMDIDSNVYNSVTIGSQIWMKENLKTTRFNNGKAIPSILGAVYNDTNAVYQWIQNDDTVNLQDYGRLYTWYVASHRCNVCPTDWHVPSDSEWTTLISFLGGDSLAGGKMKETGLAHWWTSSSSVTNSSGFTAVGGGFRGNPLSFRQRDTLSTFWTATKLGSGGFARGFRVTLQASNDLASIGVAVGQNGNSIRCIQDATVGINEVSNSTKFAVYPNPASTILNIRFEENTTADIEIYNAKGDLVRLVSDGFHEEIPIQNLPKGLYFIMIRSDEATAVRFIKQ